MKGIWPPPLIAPELPFRASNAPREPREIVRENVTILYVDPQPGPEAPPSEETPLVSTRDSRAAQPEAPPDRPQGAAFQEGRTRVPGMTTERSAVPYIPAARRCRSRCANHRPSASSPAPETTNTGTAPKRSKTGALTATPSVCPR